MSLLTCTVQFTYIIHSFSSLLQLQIYFMGKILLLMMPSSNTHLWFSVCTLNKFCLLQITKGSSSPVQLIYFLCSWVLQPICCIHVFIVVCFNPPLFAHVWYSPIHSSVHIFITPLLALTPLCLHKCDQINNSNGSDVTSVLVPTAIVNWNGTEPILRYTTVFKTLTFSGHMNTWLFLVHTTSRQEMGSYMYFANACTFVTY